LVQFLWGIETFQESLEDRSTAIIPSFKLADGVEREFPEILIDFQDRSE
jgi:hypothetical protein